MILFLNFAPLEYLGGAERKTYELYQEVRQKEKVIVLTADQVLGGAYGRMVLNQPFEDRSQGSLTFGKGERQYISFKSLIPFTNEWNAIRSLLSNARRIYIKCDLNELLLLLYFGGLSSFSKTVASVRSPWYYPSPMSRMDHFHNLVYMSLIMKFLLRQLQGIHVLTNRDKELFYERFGIDDVLVVPNFSDKVTSVRVKGKKKVNFDIVCIGELILRKGIDTILETIKKSPSNFVFHIIGDGPLKKEVLEVVSKYPNCIYHGYLPKKEVQKILSESNVLLFPSRAEGFGGVILEALSFGIPVITSKEISLFLPNYIEYVMPSRDPIEVVELLEQIENDISVGKVSRNDIKQYGKKNFDGRKIISQISSSLLDI